MKKRYKVVTESGAVLSSSWFKDFESPGRSLEQQARLAREDAMRKRERWLAAAPEVAGARLTVEED
jgi:hypothetical protein